MAASYGWTGTGDSLQTGARVLAGARAAPGPAGELVVKAQMGGLRT